MLRQDELVAVLEGCASLCLDTEEERVLVAARLRAALHDHIDAIAIRRLFERLDGPAGGPTTTEGRVAALIAHRPNLALLISSAARLAGEDT